jgi:hypothetical protein
MRASSAGKNTDNPELNPLIRERRFDLPALALGAVLTATLGVGLATVFLYLSRTTTGPDVGPTAATLSDGSSSVVGAALGLLAGSGLTACFARSGSRVATGLLAGFLAYAAVLIPIFVVTGPSDVSAAESLGFALVLGVPLGLCVIIGSMVGARLRASYRKTSRS